MKRLGSCRMMQASSRPSAAHALPASSSWKTSKLFAGEFSRRCRLVDNSSSRNGRRSLHSSATLQKYPAHAAGVVQAREMDFAVADDEFEMIKKFQRERSQAEKVHRDPFLRNMLLGKFEQTYLEYPQLTAEEHASLTAFLKPIEDLVAKIDSHKVTLSRHLPGDVVDDLARCEAFGGIIPLVYNGMELDNLQYANLLLALAADPNLATQVYIQQSWIARSILRHGTEDQKSEYLPGMARASLYGGWALAEADSGSDYANMNGFAMFNPKTNSYRIKCTKSYVTNAKDADFFIVFVKVPTVPDMTEHRPTIVKPRTEEENRQVELAIEFGGKIKPTPAELMARPLDNEGKPIKPLPAATSFDAMGIDTTWRTTAFLVDAHLPGIHIEEDIQKRGLTACNVNTVTFDCEVDANTGVLGGVGNGFAIASQALAHDRHMIPILTLPTMKRIFNNLITHVKNTKRFYRPLFDFNYIRDKLWTLAQTIYVIDSMCFQTAFLNSQTQDPSYDIESAACKLYAADNCMKFLNEVRQIYAAMSCANDPDIERDLEQAQRDFSLILQLDGSSAVAKLYVSLSCVQAAGIEYQGLVHQMRFPFQYPWENLKRLIKGSDTMGRQLDEKPFVFPEDFVHPSLENPAKHLEQMFLLCRTVSNGLMTEYGRQMFEEQKALSDVSDILTSIFAMTAALGRASRSYCLGIKQCEEEAGLATSFCTEEYFRHMMNRAQYAGDWSIIREFKQRQAEVSMKWFLEGGYCIEKAIARNLQ